MKNNVGGTDRMIRIVIAALLAVLYFTGIIEGTLGTVSLILAGALLITAVVRFCGIYAMIGVNTCKVKEG